MPSLPNQPDDLPEGLAADLRAIYGRSVPVPPAVDAEILREARAGFARRRRFQLAARVAAVSAAAAAGVALAFVIPAFINPDTPTQTASGPSVAPKMLMVAPSRDEDVDHNGKVDILDAFAVAKLIDVRGEIDKTYDVNGDGKVDQSDVDRDAMAAVETSGGDEARVQ